jgi:hypothetical protein
MPRKSSHGPRPFETVMDELTAEQDSWDLDKHLNGCLAGYQTDRSYGAAVYFALEALWRIAKDVGVRFKSGRLDQGQLNAEWILIQRLSCLWHGSGSERLGVPRR